MSITKSTEFLHSFSNEALKRASALSGRIGSYSPSPSDIDFSFTPNKPKIDKPPKIGDLLSDDNSPKAIEILNKKTDEWLDKFFPNINSCMKYEPEEWACGILTGQKPFGLSREVFDAVWHDARDRAYRAAGTEQNQIASDYSLRGFSMPPGAFISARRNSEIRAAEAIAKVNREQTIKDADIKLDLVKFAATTAAQIKTGMIGVLANFYTQWVSALNADDNKARYKAQAYSSLTSALSAYYNVEMGFEELRLKAAQSKTAAKQAKANIATQEGQAKSAQYSALAQAAKGFTEAAGAAANAQSSLQAELFSGQL